MTTAGFTSILMKRGERVLVADTRSRLTELAFDGFAPVTDEAGTPRKLPERESDSAHGVKNMHSLVHFKGGVPNLRRADIGQATLYQGIATANRPDPAVVGSGTQIFDSTLNKPLWSDGTAWRDATGVVR